MYIELNGVKVTCRFDAKFDHRAGGDSVEILAFIETPVGGRDIHKRSEHEAVVGVIIISRPQRRMPPSQNGLAINEVAGADNSKCHRE